MSAWSLLHTKPIRILNRSRKDGRLRVTVSSRTSRRHYVVTNRKGKWSCSCNGWIFPRKIVMRNGKPVLRSDGKILRVRMDCAHIRHLKGGAR